MTFYGVTSTKKLNQRDGFVYLGGAVCGDDGTETEVRRRIQAGGMSGGMWKG